MPDPITRRQFTALAAGLAAGGTGVAMTADDPKPTEAPFERDYPAPKFKPSWKKPQINRLLVQDFVIFAHSDLEMTKKLLEKEPALVNAVMDWGGGDWETRPRRGRAHGPPRHRRVPARAGRPHRHLLRRDDGPARGGEGVPHAAAEADRRAGAARVHAALPRPGRRQGGREGARLPAVGQEDRAEAEPVQEAADPPKKPRADADYRARRRRAIRPSRMRQSPTFCHPPVIRVRSIRVIRVPSASGVAMTRLLLALLAVALLPALASAQEKQGAEEGADLHPHRGRHLRPQVRPRADDGRLRPEGEGQRRRRHLLRQRRVVLVARRATPVGFIAAVRRPRLHRLRRRPRQPAEVHHPRGPRRHAPGRPVHPPQRQEVRRRPGPARHHRRLGRRAPVADAGDGRQGRQPEGARPGRAAVVEGRRRSPASSRRPTS